MIKILVTGSNGQLGQSIKRESQNYKIFNITYTDIEDLDITNSNQVSDFIEKENPDFIVNCAAYTNVDGAENDIKGAKLLNTEAVRNLTAAIQNSDKHFIHVSTDYVFDGSQNTPYKESDQTMPNSVYGSTKLEGEKIALQYKNGMVIRTSWLYSEYGKNFVKTISRFSKEKESLKVVFDQIGTPTYAGDLAKAILEIIESVSNRKCQFKHGIYHFSNEGVCSWYDFAIQIVKIEGTICKVNPVGSSEFPTVAKRPHYSVLDKSKIKKTYNIEIPYWFDSLEKMIKEQ